MPAGNPIITLTKKSKDRDYSEFFDNNSLDHKIGIKVKNRTIILPQ
jgi:hypothetical protein